MFDEYRKAVSIACRTMLFPLARILLKYGMSYREFDELARVVFVKAAFEGDTVKPNISRVAFATGLSRKEVKKISESGFEPSRSNNEIGLHDIRLLEKWRKDPKYSDNTGKTLKLYFKEKNGPSLYQLIQELEIGLPASTILKHLMASGFVEIDESGRYYPKHKLTPKYETSNPATIVHAGLFAAAHLNTVFRNIFEKDQTPLYERQTFTTKIVSKQFEEVQTKFKAIGQRALEEAEDYIQSVEEEAIMGRKLVGMGIYAVELDVSDIIEEPYLEGLGQGI